MLKLNKKLNADVYSTSEIKTNKIWLGKPIYRKLVEITQISTNSITDYPHGIKNIEMAYIEKMFIVRQTNYATRMINVFSDQAVSAAQITKTNITYIVPTSKWNWTLGDSIIYAVIEYTKTTD